MNAYINRLIYFAVRVISLIFADGSVYKVQF